MKYYSVLKNISYQAMRRQRRFKFILLSERSHFYKGYILYDSNYLTPEKGKTMEIVKRSVVVKDKRGEKG